MDKETEIHSALAVTNISSSFQIPRSIIFYSKVDSNYCLFPQADWMCNFFHFLGSWQFDNCWTATAVLATQVLPLRQSLFFFFLFLNQSVCLVSNFCHVFFFSIFCHAEPFLLRHFSCFCSQERTSPSKWLHQQSNILNESIWILPWPPSKTSCVSKFWV